MQGNEKLLVARAEIEAILKKHDIGAHVVLHMLNGQVGEYIESFTENFGYYDPSYSRIKPVYDNDGVLTGMHLNSKLAEHYNGDKVAQRRDLAATANMLHSMGVILARDAMSLLELATSVDKKLGTEHGEFRDVNPRRTK